MAVSGEDEYIEYTDCVEKMSRQSWWCRFTKGAVQSKWHGTGQDRETDATPPHVGEGEKALSSGIGLAPHLQYRTLDTFF